MRATIGVERMMEITDLPLLRRALQRVLEPGQLLAIDLVAVEREEPDVLRRVAVVLIAVHVPERIFAVGGIVVIAERGIELDTAFEQRLIGSRELLDEVLRSLAAINVVAQHDDA